MLDLIANNMLGFVEDASLTPMVAYRTDRDGRPYVPVGDGGIVLGVRLGDSVFATDGDHAAPGVTIIHPDAGARFALTAFSCIGNEVIVRSGFAAGSIGHVVGKRGESGRVIVAFDDLVMQKLLPGDRMSVRTVGQGFVPEGLAPTVELLNVDPGLFSTLPFTTAEGITTVSVAGRLPSKVCGNGIGRPAQMWDVDLALVADSPDLGGAAMHLGDLWAIENLDVRNNMGYRRGWVTVGVICHGGSPMPGHGPGLVPIACGPQSELHTVVDSMTDGPAVNERSIRTLARQNRE